MTQCLNSLGPGITGFRLSELNFLKNPYSSSLLSVISSKLFASQHLLTCLEDLLLTAKRHLLTKMSSVQTAPVNPDLECSTS